MFMLRTALKQMRPHQWVKNFLVFLPLIAAHQFREPDAWRLGALAFISFSCAASAIYIFNDLLDAKGDREHPKKKHRPIASGAFPVGAALGLCIGLLLVSIWIGLSLHVDYLYVIFAYIGLNVLYSTGLKRKLSLDVVFLSIMYTLRLLAGGAATDVTISQWLLAFSTFFFFGLALVKRYTELVRLEDHSIQSQGRGYAKMDRYALLGIGIASSFMSILILTLYFNSTQVTALYSHSERMWLTIPVFLYWTTRLWVLTERNQIDDDPVVFALKDPMSWLTAVAVGVVMWLAL